VAAALAWAVTEWRHRRLLQKAPWLWGTTPGSIRFLSDSIWLVDEQTGHETRIWPGHISFNGPGEFVSMRSEPPTLRPQNGVRRLEIGIAYEERAGLKIFGPRTGDEYLGDYDQTVDIAVLKDGSIQTRGLNQDDKRTIARY
jgi:hypothetical protein